MGREWRERLVMLGGEDSVETSMPAVPVGAASLAAAVAAINASLASQPAEAAWAVDLGAYLTPDAPLRVLLAPLVTGAGAVTADVDVYGALAASLDGSEPVDAGHGPPVALVKLASLACVAAGSGGEVPESLRPRLAGHRCCATVTVTPTAALEAMTTVDLKGVASAGPVLGFASVFDRGPLTGLLVVAKRGASSGATSVGVAVAKWR